MHFSDLLIQADKHFLILSLVFLGAVVDDPNAHFLAGQVEFLDADGVVGRAEPFLRIQAQVFGPGLLMALVLHG